jgi:hypothetical protein
MVSITQSGRAPALSGERHEEWLLDDAIDDTFPASDPISHGQPGSIVNVRYAALESRARRRRRAPSATVRWMLLGSLVACALLIVRRRQHRGVPD